MTDWTMEHAIRYFASLPAMRIGVALAAVLVCTGVAGTILTKTRQGRKVRRQDPCASGEHIEAKKTDAIQHADSPAASLSNGVMERNDSARQALRPRTAVGQMLPIFVAGASGVGKSTIAEAFIDGAVKRHRRPSFGAELFYKTLEQEHSRTYLQVWEATLLNDHQERAQELAQQCSASILVYRAEDPTSYQSIKDWLETTTKSKAGKNSTVAVIQNRTASRQDLNEIDSPIDFCRAADWTKEGEKEELSGPEGYFYGSAIPHFAMESWNDVGTIQRAFDWVIQSATRPGGSFPIPPVRTGSARDVSSSTVESP